MGAARELDGGAELWTAPLGLVRRLESLTTRVQEQAALLGADLRVAWEPLVMGRARLLGLRRAGRTSANGSCRLLLADGGWVAVNLARADDEAAVRAVIGASRTMRVWEAVEDAVTRLSASELVAAMRLVGVPAARLAEVTCEPSQSVSPWSSVGMWTAASRRPMEKVCVVDLSSMWAGPLTAMLLAKAGATVVKVESLDRPDGARALAGFYETLHPAGQEEVRLDFADESGRRQLRALLDEADVVIESSRPRALEHLGAGPTDVRLRPGRVWVSITGYGRHGAQRNWPAFGDDAAVAGGLVVWEDVGLPVFCGDAIADPLTGLSAAVATFEALGRGGGELLDVPLARQAAAAVVPDALDHAV